jgi:F0F1-type ATP synthase assembly protein I
MREPMRAVWLVAGLTLSLGLMTAAGALLGQYLDGRWGTGPWLTLAGTLCGMGAGFLEVWSLLGRASGQR